MTSYSQVYSVKSNARRAARGAGVDPKSVKPCAGGFHYPLPEAKPAEPSRWFKKYDAAKAAAKTTAERAGLNISAFAVIVSWVDGRPEYGFVPAHATGKYELATGKEKPEPKAAKAKSKSAAPKKAGSKHGDGGAKQKTVLDLITRAGGATMKEITDATGWLPHTARARISGIVKANKLKIKRERLLGVTTYAATAKAAS